MEITVLPPDYDVYLSSEADTAFEADLAVDPDTAIGRIIIDGYRAFPEEFLRRSAGPVEERDPGAWCTCLWSTAGRLWLVQDVFGPFGDGMDILDDAGTLWFNQPVTLVKHKEWMEAYRIGLTPYDPTRIAALCGFQSGAGGEVFDGILEYWPTFIIWLEDIGKNLVSDAIVALAALAALKWRDWRARRARPRDVHRLVETAKAHKWTDEELAARLRITREETQQLLTGMGHAADDVTGVVIQRHTRETIELETTLERIHYDDFCDVLSREALARALAEDPSLEDALPRETHFQSGGNSNA